MFNNYFVEKLKLAKGFFMSFIGFCENKEIENYARQKCFKKLKVRII